MGQALILCITEFSVYVICRHDTHGESKKSAGRKCALPLRPDDCFNAPRLYDSSAPVKE